MQNLHDKFKAEEYTSQVTFLLEQQKSSISNQNTWNNIVNVLNKAAENTLGFKERKSQHNNKNIIDLSIRQKQLNTKINSIKNDDQKRELKKQRNNILTEIHNQIKADENKKIKAAMKDLEDTADDNNKMYKAVKNINKLIPKQHLLLQNGEGLTANEKEQTKIIAKYFKSIFYKNAA